VPAGKPAAPERAWIEIAAIRLARVLGSLQLAVTLLSLFAAAVFLGTWMEHRYDTKIAQQLVYKAWWFVVLLLLLAVNICFAAVKKLPWKKHQAGFVITHVGLLTMLAGGVLHWTAGTDAQMQLIDTDDSGILSSFRRAYGHIAQSGRVAIDSTTSVLRVRERGADPHAMFRDMGGRGRGQEKVFEADFEPGPLAWKSENLRGEGDFLLSLMAWIQNPFGHSWSMALDGGARLEVLDFMPYARREQYTPLEKGGFPAVKLEFRSRMFGKPIEEWVAANSARGALEAEGSPMQVELLGTCPEPLLKEFLQPPAPATLTKKGQLVIVDGPGAPVRVSVEQALAAPIRLAGGLQVKATRYLPEWFAQADPQQPETGTDPAIEFELIEGGKALARLQLRARVCDRLYDAAKPGTSFPQGGRGLPLFWLHVPDVRFGQKEVRGALQLVRVGKEVYYRSFTHQDQGFLLEKAGKATPREEISIWARMEGRFRLMTDLPHASAEPHYVPAPVAPGKATDEDKARYQAAAHCRLTVGGSSREVWISHQGSRSVDVAGRRFRIDYDIKRKDLGFEIKLERAEQTVDPGTRSPASYTSYVQLFDAENGINGKREIVTMNEPLQHRGYKFYQSSYNFLDTYDSAGKPVSVSGFTVGYDPGLELKYIGSLMLGLGIFTMFYMKAYFFKERGRGPVPAPAGGPAPTPNNPPQEG
jgi:hypothetical protein